MGPRIFTETGEVYPSVRSFPSFTDAAGHALLALFNPENPFTLRYNPGTPEGRRGERGGWVSGSCFLARRSALEELGGFDEAYFMYIEDMDLCWRAHHAGWGVGFAGTGAVTHVQGASTARHPYRMMVAHHRSALRFTVRTTTGWRRAALPLAVLVLGVRMVMAAVRLALGQLTRASPRARWRRRHGGIAPPCWRSGGRRGQRPWPAPGARRAHGELRASRHARGAGAARSARRPSRCR